MVVWTILIAPFKFQQVEEQSDKEIVRKQEMISLANHHHL
jgi:hypothetical protein